MPNYAARFYDLLTKYLRLKAEYQALRTQLQGYQEVAETEPTAKGC